MAKVASPDPVRKAPDAETAVVPASGGKVHIGGIPVGINYFCPSVFRVQQERPHGVLPEHERDALYRFGPAPEFPYGLNHADRMGRFVPPAPAGLRWEEGGIRFAEKKFPGNSLDHPAVPAVLRIGERPACAYVKTPLYGPGSGVCVSSPAVEYHRHIQGPGQGVEHLSLGLSRVDDDGIAKG